MLEVTVRLIPKGDLRHASELCRLTIINDESGTEEKGNYQLTLYHPDGRTSRDRVVGVHRNKGLSHLLSACLLAVDRHRAR